MKNPPVKPPGPDDFDEPLRRELRRASRRGFLGAGVAVAAGIAAWRGLVRSPMVGQLRRPIRSALNVEETIARAGYRPELLAPTFPIASARMPIVNGRNGIMWTIEPSRWRLQVEGPERQPRSFSIEEIKALPRVETVLDLKCVEGWNTVVRWAGARMIDLAALSGLATRDGRPPEPSDRPRELFTYTSMVTPDGEYFVGLDTLSALHPQSLLCYEMDGKPVLPEHGAPLRLFTPVKYGFKCLKRIGLIRFTDRRPSDFWYQRGYDYHAGL